MALDVGEVRAVLSLDSSGFTRGLSQAFAGIGQIAAKYGPEAMVAAAAVMAAAFIATLAVKLAEGVANAIKESFTSAAAFEQTKIGFQTLFGDEAASFYPELEKFGVATPFELKELESYALWMKTARIETGDIIPILTSAGDAAAALGDPSKIEVFVRALIDMKKKGKISAEEMTRQIGQVIPAWDYVAESLGVSTQEAMKMAEDGVLDVDDTIQALIDGVQSSNMGGMMAAQMETANGKAAIFRDTVELLKRDIGAPLVQAAGPFLDMAIGGMEALNDIVNDFITVYGPEFEQFWREWGPLVSTVVIEGGIKPFLLFTDMVLTFGGAAITAFNTFTSAASNAFSGFKRIIYEYVIMPLNAAIEAINKVTGASISRINFNVGGNAGVHPRQGRVPTLADGGIVTAPTLAVVGEAGPEAVIPLSKLGGMGGQNFYITGSRADASAIAAEVRKVLRGEVGGALSRTALMGA